MTRKRFIVVCRSGRGLAPACFRSTAKKSFFCLRLLSMIVVWNASFSIAEAEDEYQWSEMERPLHERLDKLRDVPDEQRGEATIQLSRGIIALPASANKLRLAVTLAAESTEGDYGTGVTQAAADALSKSLAEHAMPFVPIPTGQDDSFHEELMPAYGYQELATLVRYEHVSTSIADSHLRRALAKLETLDGKRPPQYADQGLIVLGVTDEPIEKVTPFASRLMMRYPVLLDPGRTVESAYGVGGDQGIPKSFVYDREGRIVAQSIDARSMRQLLDMLKTAGLHLLQSLPAR